MVIPGLDQFKPCGTTKTSHSVLSDINLIIKLMPTKHMEFIKKALYQMPSCYLKFYSNKWQFSRNAWSHFAAVTLKMSGLSWAAWTWTWSFTFEEQKHVKNINLSFLKWVFFVCMHTETSYEIKAVKLITNL